MIAHRRIRAGIVCGAVVAAIALAGCSPSGPPERARGHGSPAPASEPAQTNAPGSQQGPVRLDDTLRLIPVDAVQDGECRDDGPSTFEEELDGDWDRCYTLLVDEGLSTDRLDALGRPEDTPGSWTIRLTLTEDIAEPFARLTAQLAQNPSPRNQLAIVVGDEVVSAPAVQSALTTREMTLGFPDRDSADDFYGELID